MKVIETEIEGVKIVGAGVVGLSCVGVAAVGNRKECQLTLLGFGMIAVGVKAQGNKCRA